MRRRAFSGSAVLFLALGLALGPGCACSTDATGVDAATPVDAARPDTGDGDASRARDAAPPSWDTAPFYDGGPDADVDADIDANWPDAAYDCTTVITGTPCTADAGLDSCPIYYRCAHGSCVPANQRCGSPTWDPCGDGVPYTWSEGPRDSIDVLHRRCEVCLSLQQAWCLHAADSHWVYD